ncbi:Retrotransposon nucleocapsid protein, related [Eimeria maxima]|uniref:Retrotransposon nucleocapsid protein, related n=1 Tax=Eimeria maxima TaxID=5804 RepID=U6LZL1_EIMMA|nr:Retrotransposon nucleocapsid protein, related [Eimeria maxima]CDJ56293.1 Retrotransposon nucleocapsid protein, related [Eimeria maxima]
MNAAQQKYSIYDQELLALVTALDKWSHLLRAAKVTAYTEHHALTHLQQLRASKPLRGRTARWLDFLAEFPELTILYLPGTRNQVADALSRKPGGPTTRAPSSIDTPQGSLVSLAPAEVPLTPQPETRRRRNDYRQLAGIRARTRQRRKSERPPEVTLDTQQQHERPQQQTSATHKPNSLTHALDWPGAYSKCPVFREAYTVAAKTPGETVHVEIHQRRYGFSLQHPYLRICQNGIWLICVPQLPEFLTHILYQFHDHVTAGHRGQKKTFFAISKHYYWPGMRTYTNTYVDSCVQCRASKSVSQKPAGLLQQLLIPSRRWSHVSLDFITDLPHTHAGHDAILVLVDSLSKMAHFIPTRKTSSAADTVALLADRVIRYHGFPETLVSDRDPRFTSEIWEALCSRFNIRRALSSPYHPQTDGQTERVNRTLEQMLRTYIQTDEKEWEHLLPALELAYNTTPHSSTELSPFEVMIGENPLTAADLDIVGTLPPTLSPPMTKLFQRLCERAQAHILQAKWRQKYYADSRRRPMEYKVGDRLWISSRHLPALNECAKLEPRYRGPFKVTERIGEVAYRIDLPGSYAGHNVFHVSQLIPHHPRPATHMPQDAPVGWPPVQDEAGNPTDQYLVDYILDQRGTGSSATYLVKWRGAPEERATWEPAHHLQGCPALIRAWKRRRRKHSKNRNDGEQPVEDTRTEDDQLRRETVREEEFYEHACTT